MARDTPRPTRPAPADCALLVLAGGRSHRFGRDKLAEPIGGRSMLGATIDRVAPLAGEVLILGPANGEPASQLAPAVHDGRYRAVSFVFDRQPSAGPLAALAGGLAATRRTFVLLVAGDMPFVVPAVVEVMLAAAVHPSACVVALERAARPQPLPLVLRRVEALARANTLLSRGERRLRGLLEPAPALVGEQAWRRLDPAGHTLLDLDTPADLAAVRQDGLLRSERRAGESNVGAPWA